MTPILHNRQFILCDKAVEKDGFASIRIGKFHLSYQKNLKLRHIQTADSEQMILLGDCFLISEGTPESVLSTASGLTDESLCDLTSGFSGRWVLIRQNGTMIADAAGLMGLFHSAQAVSSSIALMSECCGPFMPDLSYTEPVYEHEPDWPLAPLTKFEGVRKLLASQYLCFNHGAFCPVHHDFIRPEKFSGLGKEDILKRITEAFIPLYRNIAAGYSDIVIPLTAGVDSRTLVALARNAGIPFRTITFDYRCRRSDKKVPMQIAGSCGVRHDFVKASHGPNKTVREIWHDHTAGCIQSPDMDFMSQGQTDSLGKGSILLRGNVWEIAICYWHWRLPDADTAEKARKAIKATMPAFYGPAMDLWTEDCFKHGRSIDWRNCFLFEQRQSCWLSYIEQALDISEFGHIQPVDCADLLSMIFALDESDRRDKVYQKELISQLLPEADGIPYNAITPMERIPQAISALGKVRSAASLKALVKKHI